MTLYHTPSGKFWHRDPHCPRVLRWQWPRLKAYEHEQSWIEPKYRCRGDRALPEGKK